MLPSGSPSSAAVARHQLGAGAKGTSCRQSTGEPLRGREASSRLRGRVREERGKEPARGIPARHPGAVRIPARRVPPRAWAGQLESPLLPGAPVAQEDALGAGGGRPPAAVRGFLWSVLPQKGVLRERLH